ncbi:MAG: hypothetical protein H0V97_06990 [Actinobacteria bacterium]|nr:hypothetical protein [Actinomycetota bacterium]
MKARTSARLAWSLAFISTLLAFFSSILLVANGVTLRDVLFEGAAVGPQLALTFPIVGAIIASRHPGNPLGWIFCAIGLSQGTVQLTYDYSLHALVLQPGSLPGGDFMSWVSAWTWIPGFALLITFSLLLFPNGHLPSRRWRYVGWVAGGVTAILILLSAVTLWPFRGPAIVRGTDSLPGAQGALTLFDAGLMLLLVTAGLSLISLIVRYRRARGEERLQLRWFTFAALTLIAPVLVSTIDGVPEAVSNIGNLIGLLVAPGLPIAIGVAIMKYRLYDIDRIVNRTLVYAAVSALLVLVYIAGVGVFGGALRQVTGQEANSLAVAASTLAVAALFRPARARIQGFIDRRFYRRKYDASRTLEAFTDRLRAEVDLESLTGELLEAVHQTMQPAHVSLWLRDGEGRTQPV